MPYILSILPNFFAFWNEFKNLEAGTYEAIVKTEKGCLSNSIHITLSEPEKLIVELEYTTNIYRVS